MTTLNNLPTIDQLANEFGALAATSDAARRAMAAARDGVFVDPAGNRDPLQGVRLAPVQVALLAHLATHSPAELSVDVGFGMGTSATVIMAARAARGGGFKHFALDPYGLPEGRGQKVQAYLQQTFAQNFERLMVRSEVALGKLLQQGSQERCGLIVVDGDHRFDQVITDFFLSDQLCAVGGYIFFDDAFYPAIETAVRYIEANRPDYEVAHLPVWNTSIARKISRVRPAWDGFEPFAMAQRSGWEAVENDLPQQLP